MTSQVPICCDGIDIKHLEYDEGKTRGRIKKHGASEQGWIRSRIFYYKKGTNWTYKLLPFDIIFYKNKHSV